LARMRSRERMVSPESAPSIAGRDSVRVDWASIKSGVAILPDY